MTPALDDPVLVDLVAAVREANELATAASDALSRYLEGRADPPALADDGVWPEFPGDGDLLTIEAAASRSSMSANTLRRWCREDPRLGRKFAKEWRLSRTRLAARLGR